MVGGTGIVVLIGTITIGHIQNLILSVVILYAYLATLNPVQRGVVLACGVDRPIVRDRGIEIANNIGKALAIGIGRRANGCDRTVTEIGEVTERCPNPLNPCRLINQT